jgi:outer membrane immunogenic protein
MKKINVLVLITLLCSTVAFAQAPLGKGGKQLNAGLGFSTWGVPVYVGIDFGVHQDITVGPVASFQNYGYNAGGNKYNQNLVVLGFNGNYHFNTILDMPSQWDFYAGLTLGYYIWSDNDYTGAKASQLGLRGQVGGRYFFSDNFGINIEFGGGTSSGGGIGITYKF